METRFKKSYQVHATDLILLMSAIKCITMEIFPLLIDHRLQKVSIRDKICRLIVANCTINSTHGQYQVYLVFRPIIAAWTQKLQ